MRVCAFRGVSIQAVMGVSAGNILRSSALVSWANLIIVTCQSIWVVWTRTVLGQYFGFRLSFAILARSSMAIMPSGWLSPRPQSNDISSIPGKSECSTIFTSSSTDPIPFQPGGVDLLVPGSQCWSSNQIFIPIPCSPLSFSFP